MKDSALPSSGMAVLLRDDIVYPDSDGEPMADDDVQRNLMETVELGIAHHYAGRNIYVSANIFWYPKQGKPTIVQSPDLLVAVGRPPHQRGSYKQWLEDDQPPQFVAEIASPSNTGPQLAKKRRWYERYGVLELVEFDPADGRLEVWVRAGGRLVSVPRPVRWTSPVLDLTFTVSGTTVETDRGPAYELLVAPPGGVPFTSARRLTAERDAAAAERDALLAELRAAGLRP